MTACVGILDWGNIHMCGTRQAVTDTIYHGTQRGNAGSVCSDAGAVALRALCVLHVTRAAPGWSDWRHRENYFVR